MATYNPYNLSNSSTNLFGGGSLAASMGSNPGSVESWGGVADWSQPFSGKSNAASAISSAASAVADTATTSADTAAAEAIPQVATPTNYGVYGGRPGETPGNLFSIQYSAGGNPLPGSAAAASAAMTSADPLSGTQVASFNPDGTSTTRAYDPRYDWTPTTNTYDYLIPQMTGQVGADRMALEQIAKDSLGIRLEQVTTGDQALALYKAAQQAGWVSQRDKAAADAQLQATAEAQGADNLSRLQASIYDQNVGAGFQQAGHPDVNYLPTNMGGAGLV